LIVVSDIHSYRTWIRQCYLPITAVVILVVQTSLMSKIALARSVLTSSRWDVVPVHGAKCLLFETLSTWSNNPESIYTALSRGLLTPPLSVSVEDDTLASKLCATAIIFCQQAHPQEKTLRKTLNMVHQLRKCILCTVGFPTYATTSKSVDKHNKEGKRRVALIQHGPPIRNVSTVLCEMANSYQEHLHPSTSPPRKEIFLYHDQPHPSTSPFPGEAFRRTSVWSTNSESV
jgi:hypothetical protein